MIIDHPNAAQSNALRELWQEAFGDSDAFLDCFFRTAFSPARCRCAAIDGALAAALYWFDCEYAGEKAAYIYAVATGKDYRSRGLCRALMTDTHDLLARRGYAGAILVPGEAGLFRLYEKLGYTTCAYVREFSCAAGAAPIPVRAIGPAEYAALRRQFLPPGSVIQEKENLAFLETQARFFAGEGLLLAASREGTVLHCPELLGNANAAPGILAALGCTEGRFRSPGGEKPFAMYRPLNPIPAPGYFGLAFD